MDVLSILAETPVPTLLILAGLFFLFVAIGGQFGAKVVTDRVQPKAAALLGLALLVTGVAIFLAGGPAKPGRSPAHEAVEVPGEPRAAVQPPRGGEMPPAAPPEAPGPEREARIRFLDNELRQTEGFLQERLRELEELQTLVATDPDLRGQLERKRGDVEELKRQKDQLRGELDRAGAAR